MNETEVKEEKKNNHDDDTNDQSKEVFRWEMLLPKINVTVLLVESDRSTRRLITALLKNCSYKVIAVSNGLKAWETLKMKATDIDLILTEMELPTMSGLELLSKIMEHEICKNIPVIMMSSHDSRITAMNCMFKGAADFLIKPVRKNELTNLWQHVWRKHVINRPLQNSTSVLKNLKIATEDNFAGNQSTDSVSVASSQKNDKCSEKLSEAQSAHALPFSDAENAHMGNMENASLMKCSLKLSNIDVLKHEESNTIVPGSTKHNDETGDSRLEQDSGTAEIEPKNQILRAELSRENPDIDTKIHGCSDELIEPSKSAIDLISTFGKSNKQASEFSGSSCKQASEASEEWQRLNHSNTSAFSRYDGSKMLRPLFQNTNWNSNKSHELSVVTAGNCFQYGALIKTENLTTAVMAQYGQLGPKLFNTGLLADNVFHHTWTSKPNCQRESSPFPSSSSSQSNPESHNSDHHHNCSYDVNYNFRNQDAAEKIDLDHVVHDSPTAGQGFGNELCHASNHINGSGDVGRAASNAVTKNASNHINDSGNVGRAASNAVTMNSRSSSDGRCYKHDYYDYDDEFRSSDSQRSSQREAALTRFRLKRKERCFGKKVRYESRKKLAEQRLRVNGQFVRKVHNDDHPNADASGGDQ
ncbi:hypothetical protein TSUD_359820 [Trifolium subterraneum]|uniref:Response regulatory domain-containing protein n=1 Tax=Trifolium subterraneum TaxID=3900 RepID=A0A2Z6N9W4_TRISU|nr:hypothetical protein TSUD_359820 [Trifolium subterraneum]